MSVASPRLRGRFLLGATVAAVTLLGASATNAMASEAALYTQTNDPAGNTVQKFDRGPGGTLTAAGAFATGGAGLAGLGGRQGAVELSDDEDTVYAVNAGSNTVSAFAVTRTGLSLLGSVPSGGSAPVSIDERRGLVYVLNSGGTANVTSFRAQVDGSLDPIAGGARAIPGALGAAQVSATPLGEALVVSERVSNRLETLPLDASGRPGAPVVTSSSGTVPFGFGFDERGRAIVSEAGMSSVSSYRLGDGGALEAITPSLLVGQGAACWLAVSPNGRFAYTGNASGSVTGFAIDSAGALTALNADGRTAVLAPSPRDLDFSRDGRFLYAVSPGNTTTGGRVTGYRVGPDGALTETTSAPAAAGITGAAAA